MGASLNIVCESCGHVGIGAEVSQATAEAGSIGNALETLPQDDKAAVADFMKEHAGHSLELSLEGD
jgi:hypothetical protein